MCRTEKAEDEPEAIRTAREVVDLIQRRHDEEFGVLSEGWRVYPNASLLPGTTAEYVFKENYPLLQDVKSRYDPRNIFHKKHAIVPKLPAM